MTVTGIAIACSRISASAGALDGDFRRMSGPAYPERSYDAVVELSYHAPITPQWRVQPDLQLIIHPGGGPAIPTAFVAGVRNVVRF